ncbi:molybdate ABC transporter substrate-binding protein [soil metagenome]
MHISLQYILRLLLVGVCVSLMGCGGEPASQGQGYAPASGGRRAVTVAAAADLKYVLDEIVDRFHQEHPEIRVEVVYGSSGNLYAQIAQGGPYDLFLSADIDYPRQLIKAGRADRESEFLYAVGQIVVWVPEGSKLDLQRRGIEALLDPSVRKIAIANPRHAPYGRAAEAALKALGVYERVEGRLVLGENIAQTTQFVDTGAADIGIIALSLALSPPMRGRGQIWHVPTDTYPPLVQGGVVVAGSRDQDAAGRLRQFLNGAEGRDLLKRYGFVLPGESITWIGRRPG